MKVWDKERRDGRERQWSGRVGGRDRKRRKGGRREREKQTVSVTNSHFSGDKSY